MGKKSLAEKIFYKSIDKIQSQAKVENGIELFKKALDNVAPVMAAVLTIIGFSINDTIVIFDRIREDLKLGLLGSFTEIMNGAIGKTLSRTIITSGTTLLAAGSLFLFGGGAINAFAFTLLAGVVTGTFSSIFIAGSLVLWKNKGEKPKLADETVITQHSISTSEA